MDLGYVMGWFWSKGLGLRRVRVDLGSAIDYVVELDQIIRCEADRNYTSFFLKNGKKILVSRSLKDYETLLTGHNFLRVQQSHLVNLDYVDRYDKGNGGAVVMKDGSEVPLSPAKRDVFFQILENL